MKDDIFKKSLITLFEPKISHIEPLIPEGINNYQYLVIKEYLSEMNNVNILDAGCGNGCFSYKLANEGYTNIYAVDLFESIYTRKFKYLQSSIEELPFDDNKFDFIFSNSVIYFLNNPLDGLKEFNRVMKSDSVIVFSGHTPYSTFTIWRRIKRIFKCRSVKHLENVTFYSVSWYCQHLKAMGYDILFVDGFKVLPIEFSKYIRLINKKLGFNFTFLNNRLCKVKIFNLIKSHLAYHFIIVARKK